MNIEQTINAGYILSILDNIKLFELRPSADIRITIPLKIKNKSTPNSPKKAGKKKFALLQYPCKGPIKK